MFDLMKKCLEKRSLDAGINYANFKITLTNNVYFHILIICIIHY